MKVNVWNTIVQLSKERGVDTSVIIAAITESLRVASRKYFTNDEKINIFFHTPNGIHPREITPDLAKKMF